MKKFPIAIIVLGLALAMVGTGCKWVDTDLNNSPNSPTDVNMVDLVAQIQVSLGYRKGGDMSRFSTIPMQHLSGVDRQSSAHETYLINESDINNLWTGAYFNIMKNCDILLNKAIAQNAPHYAGIARVMMAYQLGTTSAVWGDIPYTEALKGDQGQLKAKYDSQESVYAAVQSLLDAAITDLSAPAGPIALSTTADLIYKGSAAAWVKAARSLKAKFALHLSKRNGYGAVTTALQAAGIASNADNFKFNFGNANNELNPINQFDALRGDIRVNATIVDMMNATNDPRRDAYFTKDGSGNFTGSVTGSGNTAASWVGPHYAAKNAPVYFMTYAEVKFIEAEAMLGSDPAAAAAAYNAAVIASLAQHGASDAAWEATNANEDAGSITLEKIINAKYIHLFTDSEVWTDWRRTGFPTLTVAPNAVTPDGQLPRRFVYPLSERLYNGGNMPAGVTQSDRVWWDQ